MQFTTRLTNNPNQLTFPLPVSGAILWESVPTENETTGSVWRTVINLLDIPEQHIVVPSYACLTSGYQYQWRLHCQERTQTCLLTPVTPAGIKPWQGFASATSNTRHLLSKIDCWHTASDCADVQAELLLYLPESSTIPERDLLTLSIRAISQNAEDIPLPTQTVVAEPPSPVSQMQAQPEIAKRICSPSAAAMAVAGQDAEALWPEAVTACYDTNTKAYGKWPLAIYWASQQRRLGSVEALVDWGDTVTALGSGTPVVCSIRFDKGALPGAPLAQSGGHLVVLYGIEFEKNEGFALVMDPAGDTVDQVAKRYPLQAFSHAWISHRGGAYFFEAGARRP